MACAVGLQGGDRYDDLHTLREFFTKMVRKKDGRDFSMRKLAILLTVYAKPKTVRTVGEIASLLKISASATSTVLTSLEDLELVMRGSNPGDLRSTIVGQTEEGCTYCAAIERDLGQAAKAAGVHWGHGDVDATPVRDEVDEREVDHVSGRHKGEQRGKKKKKKK